MKDLLKSSKRKKNQKSQKEMVTKAQEPEDPPIREFENPKNIKTK
jgi:hypothetical protein